jgi:hypothetical protein
MIDSDKSHHKREMADILCILIYEAGHAFPTSCGCSEFRIGGDYKTGNEYI